MKLTSALALLLASQSVSAHYIFNTLIAGSKSSTKAVRQPQDNSPFHDVATSGMTCNVNPSTADETVAVLAGDKIGFKLSNSMYHQGPVAIYLGQAPSSVENWDGSGKRWFKIAEWGATYNPLSFTSLNLSEFTTSIPANTPSGDYLVRAEQVALHLTGAPEIFVSCAQIRVTNGGSGNPSMVSIPGHIGANDANVMVNIYDTVTSYTNPGPAVWRG